MSNKTFFLPESLYAYLLGVSPPEPEVLRRLRAETAGDSMARMQIAPEQGHLLRFLTHLIGARRALEIGVYTGYSALCVASALPPEGRLIACDLSPEWTQVARRYWAQAGVAERIELHIRPALETLDELLREGQQGLFDLAFIDADKTNYPGYYERCLELLRPGGLIAVDNVLWSGRVADEAVQDPDTAALRAFNRKLAEDLRVYFCVVPIADGVTLVAKR
jgi:predicted O-methyltransferase YrrM